MSAIDYVSLAGEEQWASSSPSSPSSSWARRGLRTATGVLAMFATCLGTAATSHRFLPMKNNPLHRFFPAMSATTRESFPVAGATTSAKSGSYRPTEGLDKVLLKPGALTPLTLGPGFFGKGAASMCLFLYGANSEGGPLTSEAFLEGASKQEAWLYGARLTKGFLAAVTGNGADVVQGELVCWQGLQEREAAKKLALADWEFEFAGDVHDWPTKRCSVRVVCENGTAVSAISYFELATADSFPLLLASEQHQQHTTHVGVAPSHNVLTNFLDDEAGFELHGILTLSKLPSLPEIKKLSSKLVSSMHQAPHSRIGKFVGRYKELQELTRHIKQSGFSQWKGSASKAKTAGEHASDMVNGQDGPDFSPAFEYVQLAGAGKKAWLNQLPAKLEKMLDDTVLATRVALYFQGGAGGGSDEPYTKEIDTKSDRSADLPLARMLIARGLLGTSPSQIRFERPNFGAHEVVDLICEQVRKSRKGRASQQVVVIVHLDSAAKALAPEVVKNMIWKLLAYNHRPERRGWLVPILTDTVPLAWLVDAAANALHKFPLKRMNLYALTIDDMRAGLGWSAHVIADRLLAVTGGRAQAMEDLAKAYAGQSSTSEFAQPSNDTQMLGWDALWATEGYQDFNKMSWQFIRFALTQKQARDLVTTIMLQQVVQPDAKGLWPAFYISLWSRGFLSYQVADGQEHGQAAHVALPLPLLLLLMERSGLPRIDYLVHPDRGGTVGTFDPGRSLEALTVLWASCNYAPPHFSWVNLFQDFQRASVGRYFIRPQDTSGKFEKSVFIQTKKLGFKATQDKTSLTVFVDWALERSRGPVVVIFSTDRKSEKSGGYQAALEELLKVKRPGSQAIYSDWGSFHSLIPPTLLAV